MGHQTCLATSKDGKKILEILESSPAKGSIELLYTRRPDALMSYQKESNDTKVFAIKDEEEIVGTVAEVIRDVYIDGRAKKAAYICGLKKDYNYTKIINWKTSLAECVREDIDCYYCSIVFDNIHAQKIFEKNRKRTVNVNFLQEYTTYMISPRVKFKIDNNEIENNFNFRQATKKDEIKVIEFLNREGKKKDFFPVIKEITQFNDLSITDFYILEKNGKIIATSALWNQKGYKQYIVKKYNGAMKYAKYFNPVLKALKYIKIPNENEVLNFPMVSFLLAENDNENYCKFLLNNIMQVIKKDYDMFAIGSTKTSYLTNILTSVKNIHFDSKIYQVDMIIMNGKNANVNINNMWLECGLL